MGCGLEGASFQGQTGSGDRCPHWQLGLSTASGSLVEASEEATATAWGEGAYKSPELTEIIQSHPRYTTHLTSS